MKSTQDARTLRRELDGVLSKFKKIPKEPPARGWIHNVRESLEMSTHQLAARLKISQAAVVTLEQSEAKRTMQLSTLKKIGKALHCDVVYALVPQAGAVDKILLNRQLIVAEHGLKPILRKTRLSKAKKKLLIAQYAKKLKTKRVWEKLTKKEYEELLEQLLGKKKPFSSVKRRAVSSSLSASR